MNEGPPFKFWLNEVAGGRCLTEAEAEQACQTIISGNANSAQIGGFLMALRVRGETIEEITGFARALRARMLTVTAPADAVDICGTGGDNSGSFNVSTAAAFVVAGCGLSVAKHGNRAQSSRSGSADVLTALGIDVEAPINLVERAIVEAKIGFLMAPRHHPAMRYAAEPRRDLGTRTIFNLIGPLTNPANVARQIVGVFSPQWVMPFAEVLRRLGSEACWVVHGEGLDEITTTGPTLVAALQDGHIRSFTLHPEALGLRLADRTELAGGSPQENAMILRSLLDGQPGALRDIVLLNAAAALVVAGRVRALQDGLLLAGTSIDSGAARESLARLIAITSERL